MSWLEAQKELTERAPGWWQRLMTYIPELAVLDETPQPPEHHAEGDVGIHTRLAVEACPDEASPTLLWAALLHDIGKPEVTREKDGKLIAYGHHKAGSRLAWQILQRLGMPGEEAELIAWLVENHTFHLSWNLKTPEQASKKQLRKIADPRFKLLLDLLEVDSKASHSRSKDIMAAWRLYQQLWSRQAQT